MCYNIISFCAITLDEESASVSNFNGSVFHVEKCDFENVAQCVPVGLSLPCRLSIISRCFDELQLSLGCIHTMSHPLSTSGQTRELLKVSYSVDCVTVKN